MIAGAGTQYLGSDAQVALLRRGRDMFHLLGDDPRFSYYGRTVGIMSPRDGDFDALLALTRLQGNSHYAQVSDADVPALLARMQAAGLAPVRYARWQIGELSTPRAFLDDQAQPEGLTFHDVSPQTDPDLLASFAQMALENGVLPPALDMLGGALRPGLCRIACDGDGRVLSCAGAAAFTHPDHPLHDTAWWGMLATRPEARGRRLSLILGAQVLLEMQARFGFSRFFTGIEPGNAASEAVCTRLGLSRTDTSTLGLADPALLPGGRMTK